MLDPQDAALITRIARDLLWHVSEHKLQPARPSWSERRFYQYAMRYFNETGYRDPFAFAPPDSSTRCWFSARTLHDDHRVTVLRNLSKHVFVREDTYDNIVGNFTTYRLGEALVVHISWSTNRSVALGFKNSGTMHHGGWAGDRFDVVRLDKSHPCDEIIQWPDWKGEDVMKWVADTMLFGREGYRGGRIY